MILPLLDKYFQRTASQSLTQTEQHLSGGKKSIQEDLVTHCNLSQMNLQVFAASLFLTWMCSVICFPHSTETGTAEGHKSNHLHGSLDLTHQEQHHIQQKGKHRGIAWAGVCRGADGKGWEPGGLALGTPPPGGLPRTVAVSSRPGRWPRAHGIRPCRSPLETSFCWERQESAPPAFTRRKILEAFRSNLHRMPGA
ncbi:uncharacterized protein LOC115948476 isoform X2 [Geospiza fortis]|uniref:Uncharacterized protein LOC115948476 isoform X2 n=1 Tax=Geospiza fortis TaxID=48883 RepID=A0A8N5EU23_GEOFO|nr:uncharacterized protein LOC115948476 isoform X2 [Geospiza fortis]